VLMNVQGLLFSDMRVIAFLSPVPSGHSNVHVSVIKRILASRSSEDDPPLLALHVISDEPLRERIRALPDSEHTTIAFHALGTTDVFSDITADMSQLRVPPLSLVRAGGLQAFTGTFMPTMCPEPGVYLDRYLRLLTILQNIKPDIVVIDIVFASLGRDACNQIGAPFIVQAPISSLDLSLMTQPGARGFWKFPMYGFKPR
jgi:hypothetical protein